MTLLEPYLDRFAVIPLYLACVIMPVYGLVQVQAGIAHSYDWPNLALMPFFIIRQLAHHRPDGRGLSASARRPTR